MARKKYKVGDRIFFERIDGSIDTAIVLKVTEKSYINDRGKETPFQELTIWESESGNSSFVIEDYICLSKNNPKCKVLAAKYKEFDKVKDEIISSLIKIISPWECAIQSEIIDTLKLKLHI